jgi:hypothetical protein
MARGFLPQGLSNTCPQTGAMRSVVTTHGQVSNKPKRNLTFIDVAKRVSDCDRSGRSRMPTDDRDNLGAERLHPMVTNQRCRPTPGVRQK